MIKGKRETRLLLLRRYIHGCILVNGRLYLLALTKAIPVYFPTNRLT